MLFLKLLQRETGLEPSPSPLETPKKKSSIKKFLKKVKPGRKKNMGALDSGIESEPAYDADTEMPQDSKLEVK